MMLITMLTTGSRGDTQPYIALGLALQKVGHRVRIAASEGFGDFVAQYGLEFAPTRGDVSKIASSELAKDAMNADSPLKFFKSMQSDELTRLFLDLQRDLYDACHGADVIVYHPGAAIGYFVAQEMNIPSVLATPFPMSPTGEYPNLLFYDGPRLGRSYNRLTHQIFEQGFWMMCKSPVKKFWANEFGQPPKGFRNPFKQQRSVLSPTIISCSPAVLGAKDWPQHVHCEGYWFLEHNSSYTPLEEMNSFLEAGEPPVYVGFGSIGDKSKSPETTALVVEALRHAGKRGVIATGWGALQAPDEKMEDMLFISSAPHDWLFPRMAAVVHHGGAGTTAEGLRAGVPGVIIPFANDQFAWGRRIYELSVGARAIRRKQLTAEKLAEAILYTQTQEVKTRARKLGETIRSERGAEKSAQVILSCVEQWRGDEGYAQGK